MKMARHNTAYCSYCFQFYVYEQVRRAISEHNMLQKKEPVLVAVSGGKDSLALWDILTKLGYHAVGLHLNLGIGSYSAASQHKVEAFACARDLELITHDYQEAYGLGVVEIAQETARPACSACGTMKRYHFNRIAKEKDFPVVATGHNLDDEAARLLGNVLQWQENYLQKQSPSLSSEDGKWARKVKPLCRLTEREMAAYTVISGIDYIIEECPMSKGAKMFLYKEMLNRLEESSPGTKHHFYLGYLQKKEKIFSPQVEDNQCCTSCGQATRGKTCAYCRLVERVAT